MLSNEVNVVNGQVRSKHQKTKDSYSPIDEYKGYEITDHEYEIAVINKKRDIVATFPYSGEKQYDQAISKAEQWIDGHPIKDSVKDADYKYHAWMKEKNGTFSVWNTATGQNAGVFKTEEEARKKASELNDKQFSKDYDQANVAENYKGYDIVVSGNNVEAVDKNGNVKASIIRETDTATSIYKVKKMVDRLGVSKDAEGEREFRTYYAWRAACKMKNPNVKFDGDEEICEATPGIGHWDGDKGVLYNTKDKKTKDGSRMFYNGYFIEVNADLVVVRKKDGGGNGKQFDVSGNLSDVINKAKSWIDQHPVNDSDRSLTREYKGWNIYVDENSGQYTVVKGDKFFNFKGGANHNDNVWKIQRIIDEQGTKDEAPDVIVIRKVAKGEDGWEAKKKVPSKEGYEAQYNPYTDNLVYVKVKGIRFTGKDKDDYPVGAEVKYVGKNADPALTNAKAIIIGAGDDPGVGGGNMVRIKFENGRQAIVPYSDVEHL
jgi:hypothetical protein